MKPYVIAALLLIAVNVASNRTEAQVRVGVNVNIGDQPEWGPVGYERAEYYYLPDIESYYYVPQRQFIYLSNGKWIFSMSLPPRYVHYDLYSGYKVVINSPRPYRYFETHRVRYAPYRGYYGKQECRRGYKGNNGRGNAYGHYKHRH